MEWLRRIELIIYENTYFEIFPIQQVIKLIPYILLLLKEKHGIHFVIHFEIIVIAESSKENSLVSTKRGLILLFLFSESSNCLHFEQFYVASVHLGGRCPAIIRQVFISLWWELEKEAVIEGAKAVVLFIQFQGVTVGNILQTFSRQMFEIESVHGDFATVIMVVLLRHDLHFDVRISIRKILSECTLRYEQTLT